MNALPNEAFLRIAFQKVIVRKNRLLKPAENQSDIKNMF